MKIREIGLIGPLLCLRAVETEVLNLQGSYTLILLKSVCLEQFYSFTKGKLDSK